MLGRLHPTPLDAVRRHHDRGRDRRARSTVPRDLDFLVGIYAFGALLGLTIAHVSIVVLRYREPERKRPYRIPLSVRVRGGELPLPAVLGAVVSLAMWVSAAHHPRGARSVGTALDGRRARALRHLPQVRRASRCSRASACPSRRCAASERDVEYGSILVPLFGTPLDDDIVQTAGRLAAEEDTDALEEDEGATIEALWVFEVPMSLPIDARCPRASSSARARRWRGPRRWGRSTRASRSPPRPCAPGAPGAAIVEEARRRGVQAIVLAAEEPSKIRGGALLGGRGGPLDNFVGEVTKYVVTKAPCQVILTAPPASEWHAKVTGRPAGNGDGAGPQPGP